MATAETPGGRPPSLPLWRLLQAACAVVGAVRGGQSATAAIASLEGALRPGAQALAFQALRQLGRAEALRRLLAKRAPPPAADALLCTALALCWREEGAPYEIFTLVDQAVEAAKRGAETKAQANFINACLRRFLREREALIAATDANPEARWNHPRWWIERLKKDHPRYWQQILDANNGLPPMTLRVNARKATAAAYLSELAAAGIEASAVGEHGIVLARPRPVHEIPGFDDGTVSVQDAAAQMAASCCCRAWRRGQARSPCASSTPAPRRAERPPMSSSSWTLRLPRWTSTRHAASASTRTWGASACPPA
jgi:16S rRNA (cytosine967-C5)-methyltransferase